MITHLHETSDMTGTSDDTGGRRSRAWAVTALLLSLAGCGDADDVAANNAVNVIEAQVSALEDAAAVTARNSTADLLNEQANQVREIDEARKVVAAEPK